MSSRRMFLVTSATTPLGRALSVRLATAGEVVGVRGPLDPPPDADQHIACTADLTRSADVRKVVAGVAAELRVDTIVHLGASAPDRSCRTPNALSTRLLLDGAEQLPALRAFVLNSTALVYRLKHDDPALITERHPLELSAQPDAPQRDWVEADVTAGQRLIHSGFRISVLRPSPVIAAGLSMLDAYLRLDPCYRPLGFDPMINVLSPDDAVDALAGAAEHAPRGVFNVAGAVTLPFSELACRACARCWAVPAAAIEPLCALRGLPRLSYRGLGDMLHHGLVVDGRAATNAFGFLASHAVAHSI